MTGLRLIIRLGSTHRFGTNGVSGTDCLCTGTKSRGGRVSGLDQRLVIQRLHHGLALGTGTVDRGTTIDLSRFAHRRGGRLVDLLGQRFVERFLLFIDRRRRNRAGSRLAHYGRRQIVLVIFIIKGGDGRATTEFPAGGSLHCAAWARHDGHH